MLWKDSTLLTAQAFTSIALVSLLTTPVIVFIQGLPSVMQCVGNFDRIQEYGNYHEDGFEGLDNENLPTAVALEGIDLQSFSTSRNTAYETPSTLQTEYISLDGQEFAWSKANSTSVISLPSLSIKKRTVTAIVGPVGSGKSSLLNALLGEMAALRPVQPNSRPGGITLPQEAAYCAQQPWLENGTIRQVVLGASGWDEKWYHTVVAACCLDVDIGQLQWGDQTRVGSAGVNLSGGQKQRIVSCPCQPLKYSSC